MQLPGRDILNVGMLGGSVAGLAGFVMSSDPTVAGTCLGTGLATNTCAMTDFPSKFLIDGCLYLG